MARTLHDVAEMIVPSKSGAGFLLSKPGLEVSRGVFFAGLFILGFANGLFERAVVAIDTFTAWGAIFGAFGISVVVWAAGWIAVSLLLRLSSTSSMPSPSSPSSTPASRADLAIGLAVIAAVLVPSAPPSWIALTGLGLYLLWSSEPGSLERRAAFVVVAVTVPMFWSRLLFMTMSDLLLQADAVLVGWIVGTERSGNAVMFADGWGYLFIAPGCSSLTNVSLAVLAWVLFTQALGRRVGLGDVGYCLAGCAAVVLVNVVRIGLIGLHREHFELIHGPVGGSIAGFFALAAIFGINMIGARRELFSRL